MNLEQLKNKIKAAGVVGAGGAGFPTHMKLAQGIDSILINGAECEPLLYTDYVILREQLEQVVSGAEELCTAMQAKQVLLALKLHTAQALSLDDGQSLGSCTRVCVMPDVYPMGDEIVMIYQVLGRLVPPGQLPSSVGVVVVNVETAYNIHQAVRDIPVTHKWVMLGGNLPDPQVVRVPINCEIKQLLYAAGIQIPERHVIVDGGPVMGTVVRPLTARITKKTKAILLLPEHLPSVVSKTARLERLLKRTPSACCQCTFCTDLCPRHLLGYPLEPHKTLRSVGTSSFTKSEDLLTASLCSGCGICTLMACCQGITPSATMVEVKRRLAQSRIAYRQDVSTEPHPEREWRMVPVSRLKSRIGVAAFDRMARWAGDLAIEQRVYRLQLSQHVGKPSIAVVVQGERVTAGQLVAKADEGISAALHTPVSGVVSAVRDNEIEIETGEVR